MTEGGGQPFLGVLRAPNGRERDHLRVLARRLSYLVDYLAKPDARSSALSWTRAEVAALVFVLAATSLKPEHIAICQRARLALYPQEAQKETVTHDPP